MIDQSQDSYKNYQNSCNKPEYLDFIPSYDFKFHQEQNLNQLFYKKISNPSFLNFQHSTLNKPLEKKINKPINLKLIVQYPSYNIIIRQRNINQCKGDILIIPYITINMQVYPGNILKQNFQANILQKLKELNAKEGDLYLKRSPILKYQYIAFIKVSSFDLTLHLSTGINSIISKMKQKNKKFKTVSLINDGRFDSEKIVKRLMSEIQLKFNSEQQYINVQLIVQDGLTYQRYLNAVCSINSTLQ